LNYSSPKGKVKEARHKSYRYPEYKKIYDEYQNLKHTKALYTINSRIERAKMSNSIRHDVLKRDSFKCCYCGRTAADGARLEVDHIIPVSKGGKTEMNNLQTLCDRCNSGKSNKL
jgi:5-methylcytosine-specific restriction endonuclease McrA